MAGGAEEIKYTGFKKLFNTETLTGRANISKATLGALALVAIYFKLKPSKKPADK